MSGATADRNLLFGILALQMDFIRRDALIAAMNAWVLDKAKPLGQILLEQGQLAAERLQMLDMLVAEHLKAHGHDAERSLAALAAPELVRGELRRIADRDLDASLAQLSPTPSAVHDVLATTALVATDGARFQILRPHAIGGLGEVFVARDGELNREVALKEIQARHADHPESRARFVREAEITGGLEHPGIVPVYALGQYPDGRPYYAMRFIRGDSLKQAIDRFHTGRSRLPSGTSDATGSAGQAGPTFHSFEFRQLLSRFIAVSNAIAYAHSRGVLHRDLKPANIMLGEFGETLVVDWGLAKSVGRGQEAAGQEGKEPDLERTTDPVLSSTDSELTRTGQALGTPAYMSPEQAAGRLDKVGPASDVYSLGATLYNLLTGQAPFAKSNVGEVLNQVQRGDFPRPRSVARQVPAALEAICLKAMALQPHDRYASAKALADDLEHWLADEPVSIYRDSLPIRLGRWARKHRTTVAVAAALLQTAVVVLAVSVLLIGRSRAQVDRERRRAEAVNAFLVRDLLAQADPRNNPEGAKLTVRELLNKAAGAVETSPSIKVNPEVEGAIRSAIGNTYYGLGLYQRAREELERAVACQDRVPEVAASERIFTKNRLCWVIYKLGSFDETMAKQVLAQSRAELGPDHEQTIYAADTLATITLGNKHTTEGFALLRENLATQQRVLGSEHPLTIRAALNFADGLMSNQQGDIPRNLAEAQTVMLAARDASKSAFNAGQPERLYFESALGFLYARQGKFAEAREVLAPLQQGFLKAFGPNHIDIARYWENLALAEEGLRHPDVAEALLRKSYAIRKSAMGDGHGLTRRAAAHLARVCMAQGKTEEAVAWLRVLLTEGVTRTGWLAGPSDQPASSDRNLPPVPPRGAVDIRLLGDALSGKGDPNLRADLLDELDLTLKWILWGSDWFRAHVSSLRFEAMCQYKGIAKFEIVTRTAHAVPVINQAIRIMEASPATPPRFLDEARARLKRFKAANSGQPLPR